MRSEPEIIPYHSTDLTRRRVLVFAPHPDDETIGCGGVLALHRQAGDPVRVIFLTNGAQGDVSGRMDKEAYVALRQEEAREACALLGVDDLHFWDYEDRALADSHGTLSRVIDSMADYGPELIYCPSPLEFHPDHRAACFLVCDAIGAWEGDCRVAFYEIGQPIRVTVLVDITGVLEKKRAALHAYQSQIKERPYHDVSLALSRYRSMTLPKGATHAEGFSVWEAAAVRKFGPFALPFHSLERLSPRPGEAGPMVSVIVRTRNRPAILSHAVRSIVSQTYRHLEIVLVNDGGEDVEEEVRSLAAGIPVVSIRHEQCKGRAAAANSGLEAAGGAYLNFLDDDDILYPSHLETLVSCLQAKGGDVAYSDVMNVYYRGLPEVPENRLKEELIFRFPFDPDRLLFENYIPSMSVLFSRRALVQTGRFCEDLDLFEDWDFWVRMSRQFPFHHVAEITAEYRFYGTPDMETAHRDKYAYDRALALMFERNLPFITGRAWVGFLKTRYVGVGRADEWGVQAGQEARQGVPDDSRWKEAYEALHKQWEEVNQSHMEALKALDRMKRHPLFRVYRKMRRLVGGYEGTTGAGGGSDI